MRIGEEVAVDAFGQPSSSSNCSTDLRHEEREPLEGEPEPGRHDDRVRRESRAIRQAQPRLTRSPLDRGRSGAFP